MLQIPSLYLISVNEFHSTLGAAPLFLSLQSLLKGWVRRCFSSTCLSITEVWDDIFLQTLETHVTSDWIHTQLSWFNSCCSNIIRLFFNTLLWGNCPWMQHTASTGVQQSSYSSTWHPSLWLQYSSSDAVQPFPWSFRRHIHSPWNKLAGTS